MKTCENFGRWKNRKKWKKRQVTVIETFCQWALFSHLFPVSCIALFTCFRPSTLYYIYPNHSWQYLNLETECSRKRLMLKLRTSQPDDFTDRNFCIECLTIIHVGSVFNIFSYFTIFLNFLTFAKNVLRTLNLLIMVSRLLIF